MAFLAAIIPAVIGAVGSILKGQEARVAGIYAEKDKEFEAIQLEQEANKSIGIAQREALQEKKRAELIASRAIAVAASGGARMSDPSIVNLIADIESEGAYRQAVSLYQGEERARQLRIGAGVARDEGANLKEAGRQQQRATDWEAAGYVAQGASSLYSRYGRATPAGGTKVT